MVVMMTWSKLTIGRMCVCASFLYYWYCSVRSWRRRHGGPHRQSDRRLQHPNLHLGRYLQLKPQHGISVKQVVWSMFADERTKDWFLVGSPLVPLAVIYIYLKFVREWGPKFMENRQPYDLKNTLLVYNIVQVIFSVYLFIEVRCVFLTILALSS